MDSFHKNVLCSTPQNLLLFYYKYEKLIIAKYENNYSYLKFPVKCHLLIFKNKIFFKIAASQNIYKVQNYVILIKKFMHTILVKSYKKLHLTGIGFKVIKLTRFLVQALVFKLGFSHFVYLFIQNNISTFCVELSKIFITSSSITNLLNTIFLIKLLRSTNVYTGKGVLFYNEKIILKTVKSA